jgi:hypothetical protein
LPSVWGVIIVRIFMKEKFIQAKKGTTRDIFISEHERNNKDDLFSF